MVSSSLHHSPRLPTTKRSLKSMPVRPRSAPVLVVGTIFGFAENGAYARLRLLNFSHTNTTRGVLSRQERLDYISAAKCLQSKPALTPSSAAPGAKTRFDDFVATHINQTLSIHYTGNFLSWHRYFTWIYEEALRNECGYKGTQPVRIFSPDDVFQLLTPCNSIGIGRRLPSRAWKSRPFSMAVRRPCLVTESLSLAETTSFSEVKMASLPSICPSAPVEAV